MSIRICLAGATGWAGSALARAIAKSDDITLVSAVSRTQAGHNLEDVLAEPLINCPVYATAQEALIHPCDVFFDFTKPEVAKSNVLAALQKGAHVVIGTSGLTDADYSEIANVAEQRKKGVLAVGNFALTVVLLEKFSEIAARYIPHWEIIDYATAGKIDAPSGTARELANRLSKIRESQLDVALDSINGPKESRGVRLDGSQIHSVRLPGYVISLDAIFGMPDQKLILRHESGSGAEPYVDGALLAIRKVGSLVGLKRGLDSVMDF
ncbi:MAG: 4-hydroxy-tetrahydrodipicolinate reductase [Anaerolineales bacterium]|jgi:4-hydroxy-tetrahydrodipicolinate reductase